jgi:hypothetical protein
MGSKRKISETTEFLLKYATFCGGFLMFSLPKKQQKKHYSVRTKKLHKLIKKN